jgi:hypothetical protein
MQVHVCVGPYVKESRLDLFFIILFLGPNVNMQVLVCIACGGSTLARQSNESRSEYCLETWSGWTR